MNDADGRIPGPAERPKPPDSDPPPNLPAQPPAKVTLESLVADFTSKLFHCFSDRIKRRPKPFKRRVLSLLQRRLPPLPEPGGRPRQPRITLAVEMYQQQKRELVLRGQRKVNWHPIGQACIPGYGSIRSDWRRRSAVQTLRNSVYARLKRRKGKKAAGSSPA